MSHNLTIDTSQNLTNEITTINILRKTYYNISLYIWLLISFIEIIGLFGNAWTLIIILYSGSKLQNFKFYFLITFIIDFLMVLILGVNQILENIIWHGDFWIGLENISNCSCKIMR